MKIEIVKNKYGSCFAIEQESKYVLFQFEWRTKSFGGPAWYFWLRKDIYSPYVFNVKKNKFPMEFFENACKAKGFILCGKFMDENVEIVKGIEYIK